MALAYPHHSNNGFGEWLSTSVFDPPSFKIEWASILVFKTIKSLIQPFLDKVVLLLKELKIYEMKQSHFMRNKTISGKMNIQLLEPIDCELKIELSELTPLEC